MFATEIVYEIPQQYTYEIVETKYSTVPIEIMCVLMLQKETCRYNAYFAMYAEYFIPQILQNNPPLDLEKAQKIFTNYDLTAENYGFL